MLPYFTQGYSYGILRHELKRGLDQQHPCPIPAGSVWASIVQGKWILVIILQYGAREDLILRRKVSIWRHGSKTQEAPLPKGHNFTMAQV